MANPYAMTPLYHSPGVQSYCGPSDNLSLAGHYTDMRSSAGWYGSTANDPRFASEYFSRSPVLFFHSFVPCSISPNLIKSHHHKTNGNEMAHQKTIQPGSASVKTKTKMILKIAAERISFEVVFKKKETNDHKSGAKGVISYLFIHKTPIAN